MVEDVTLNGYTKFRKQTSKKSLVPLSSVLISIPKSIDINKD